MKAYKQQRKSRRIFFAAAALLAAIGLSGCRIGDREIVVSGVISQGQVFWIGSTACSLKEAKVYLANYQNIYGSCCGVNLWEHDFGETSLADYVKDVTLEQLTQVYCMDLLAEEKDVALSEEELALVAQAAEAYYESLSEEEIAYMGVSVSNLADYYGHYALAQKVYHSLTTGVNEEVSDDEARVMEIMQIFVTDSGKAAEVAAKLAGGEDFATVANNYNELASIQVTVARDELPAEVEDVAFQMDDNEISGKIETENGYYFIKCLNKYDEELTEANKSNIVEKREKEAFDDVYHEFVSSLEADWNQDLWVGVTLDTESGEIVTATFFSVYETYCGDI